MVVAYDSLRFLPDELLLLIFNRLSRGDQARAARCSRYLYWRFLPLIWSTVNLRVSWSQAKRICSTIRRNECIGPLVQHFDLSPDAALTGAWADPLVILPVLVSTMSKLVNLRVLVFHFGTKLRPGMLQQCNFQRLESLKMALTTDNVDFVANHPSITALDPVLRSSWDVARRLGHGAQLAYVSVDGALLVDMLKNGAGRRLAPGCYVRLDDAFWADQAHSLCAALGASDVRIGLLHLNSHMFIHRRIPAGVTTDKIDGLRVPFLRRHAHECYDGARNLMGMCLGLRTLEFESASVGGEERAASFAEALDGFAQACESLRSVTTAWGTRWDIADGIWKEVVGGSSRNVDPFAPA